MPSVCVCCVCVWQHWSGLVGDYDGGRWGVLFDAMAESIATGSHINNDVYQANLLSFEQVCVCCEFWSVYPW